MDSFRETAFCLTLWYALLTLLVAVLAIALYDLDALTALLAAATVALLFALVLMARAARLTEHNVTRGQFWRTVPSRKRPARRSGRTARAPCPARDLAQVRQRRRNDRDRACGHRLRGQRQGRFGWCKRRAGAGPSGGGRRRDRLPLGAPAADELKRRCRDRDRVLRPRLCEPRSGQLCARRVNRVYERPLSTGFFT